GTEFGTNTNRLISFGWRPTTNTNAPAYMGYQETSIGGNTLGDLIFGTRSVNTDTAPSERMRIKSTGEVYIGATSPANTIGKLDVTGTIIQRSGNSGAANAGNYLVTNGDNSYSSTNLNPGVKLYNSNAFVYGMDIGYNSTSSRYRTRLMVGDNADVSLAY